MTWQRYNKNLRKSALLAVYFSFWRDQGDRSLIFYFERGKDSGVKATSVFFRLARARQSPKDPLKIIQKRCKDTTYYGNSQTFWRKKSMTCPLDPVPLILVSLMYFLLQFLVFCLPFGIAFAHPIVHPFQLAVGIDQMFVGVFQLLACCFQLLSLPEETEQNDDKEYRQ